MPLHLKLGPSLKVFPHKLQLCLIICEEYELLPLSETLKISGDVQPEAKPKGMQESLQTLQTMKNPPRPVEMKGGYLSQNFILPILIESE